MPAADHHAQAAPLCPWGGPYPRQYDIGDRPEHGDRRTTHHGSVQVFRHHCRIQPFGAGLLGRFGRADHQHELGVHIATAQGRGSFKLHDGCHRGGW